MPAFTTCHSTTSLSIILRIPRMRCRRGMSITFSGGGTGIVLPFTSVWCPDISLSSEVFPPALTNGAEAASHNAMELSVKMLKEACVQRALCYTLVRWLGWSWFIYFIYLVLILGYWNTNVLAQFWSDGSEMCIILSRDYHTSPVHWCQAHQNLIEAMLVSWVGTSIVMTCTIMYQAVHISWNKYTVADNLWY